jgi:hypothetical protein
MIILIIHILSIIIIIEDLRAMGCFASKRTYIAPAINRELAKRW